MGKQKTSNKSKKFSKNQAGKEIDPNAVLSNKKIVMRALFESLIDGDEEAFKEILLGHLEALDRQKLALVAGVSIPTLYRMTQPQANPTLRNLTKIFKALKAA